MKEYQKIETLYKFDSSKRKFVKEFYNPLIEYLAPLTWLATEKVDGTNTRIQWDGHKFNFSGRTDQSTLPNEVVDLLNEKFDHGMEIAFEQKFGNKEVILFMESFGGKIQNGVYSIKQERLIGFDIMVGDIYLDRLVAFAIFKEFGFETVPCLNFEKLQDAIDFVLSKPKSYIDTNAIMEGLVVMPTKRIYDHMGNRIIVKIKVKDLEKLEAK